MCYIRFFIRVLWAENARATLPGASIYVFRLSFAVFCSPQIHMCCSRCFTIIAYVYSNNTPISLWRMYDHCWAFIYIMISPCKMQTNSHLITFRTIFSSICLKKFTSDKTPIFVIKLVTNKIKTEWYAYFIVENAAHSKHVLSLQ